MTPKVKTEAVSVAVSDGTRMGASIARPERPLAGLIVLQEIFGVNAHIRDITQRFAREGYLVIAPELFHRSAPGFESGYTDMGPALSQLGSVTAEGLEFDLKAAFAWLQGQGLKAIGAVGFCFGGRSAYLANALSPLRCAVSFYGGRIAPDLVDRAKDQSGPLLLFWSGRDKHIPMSQRAAVTSALRKAEKPFVEVEFSDADHGFFCDARSSFEPAAAEQAWALTKVFLRRHLAP